MEQTQAHKICEWCNKDISQGVEACQYVGCGHLSTDEKIHVPPQFTSEVKEIIVEKIKEVEKEPEPEMPKNVSKKMKLKEKDKDSQQEPSEEEKADS